MLKQRKSNSNLIYLLDFLFKKREKLVSSFLDKEPEWVSLSFKYERNQTAFDLVRDQFATLWIDKHFQDILEDDISDNVKEMGINLFSGFLSDEDSHSEESLIKHSLLSTKQKIIQELLKHEDQSAVKFNELKSSYYKDKALFEREFRKYESEL